MTHPVRSDPASDPAIAEEVDLDPDRKVEILSLDRVLDQLNHFEVLGLQPGASSAQVKKAYHEASRRYHPDRYFQKNLGSFRARTERIFKRISEANAVLTDPARRQEYEQAHPELKPAPAAPVHISPEDARRSELRRARLAKHPYLAKAKSLNELIARSKESLKTGDFGKAYTDLHLASQFDPKNRDIHELLTHVRHEHEKQRAGEELRRGMESEKSGDLAAATRSFLGAANLDKKNALAASKGASLLFKTAGDPKEARALAQRAVDLEPTNADHRFLLSEILEAAGMTRLATRQLEETFKLNPNHPEAKKRLKPKKSRWPF
jgi:curved DNA-binding protein CbpA